MASAGRNALALVFAISIASLFSCSHAVEPPHPPLGITARATVGRVIDGDTIVVIVQMPVTIRLRDCWAPERHTVDGDLATEFMHNLVQKGTPVVLHAGSEDARNLSDILTFGRVVGDIWPGDSRKTLSEIMVDAGHATKEKVRK